MPYIDSPFVIKVVYLHNPPLTFNQTYHNFEPMSSRTEDFLYSVVQGWWPYSVLALKKYNSEASGTANI